MNSTLRIKCPKAGLEKSKRIKLLFDEIERWVNSEALNKLIKLFARKDQFLYNGDDLKERITFLKDYSSVWDYRKGKERWSISDEKFVELNSKTIMQNMDILGLTGIIEPLMIPDFLLPLGGARLSNYVRTQMTKKIIVNKEIFGKKIVALSGTRPISEEERKFVNQYAPNASTEFEAINVGLEKALGVTEFEENKSEYENLNLCSAVRRYKEKFNQNEIFSIAAPSSEPDKRRANSYDTFNYFLKNFNISKGDRLLLITSCIYVPFQLLKFMDLAIEGDFEVDCIGSDEVDAGKFSKASNYLQEVKATIDAIYGLSELYL